MLYALVSVAFAEDPVEAPPAPLEQPAPGADARAPTAAAPPAAAEAAPVPAEPAPAPAEPTPPAAESEPPPPTEAPSKGPDPAPPAPGAPAPLPTPGGADALDTGEATELALISRKDLRALRPSPFHLPPHPRNQVDFTAYTLEWGEVKLGLANITIGILPHVQVGTSVPLDALGIPNVTAKAHATEGGPFDIAGYVNYYVLPRDQIGASLFTTGAITSFTFNPYWSLHVGGGYADLNVEGEVDFSSLGSLFALSGALPVIPFAFEAQMFTGSVATDVRFNRRDSIILRGEAVLWTESDTSIPSGLLELAGLDEALEHEGWMAPNKAYTATLAWQFAWEHIELRLGGGVSSGGVLPWVIQSAELSYRFGGPTRIRERKMREGHADTVEAVERARKEAKRLEREAAKAARKAKKKGK